MTGIELTADSCILVDVRRGAELPRVDAVQVLDGPASSRELARLRRKRFSSRARVIAWEHDPAALQTLRDAGFVIDAVLTPEQALAVLAAGSGRADGGAATAWLALTRRGAALVIVRGGETLYSRRIAWRSATPASLNQQLLQRYVWVSYLAPELQHGMDAVRAARGVSVDAALTCGDLPDLRSLTMPLIEELDLEVETLDSLDGLEIAGGAAGDRAGELAPAIRLAAAAAALPPVEAPRRGRWWGRAAALAVLGLAAWLVLPQAQRRSGRPETPAPPPPAPTATTGAPASEPQVVPLIAQPAATAPPRPRRADAAPLPTVSSILIGQDRRLAILDGSIVEEGDLVGGRRVVRIERAGVVLREAGGAEVRVGMRGVQPAPPR